ncbi:MAG TPA: hypothetical protein VMY77_08910 [Chitinophagaceae bacterium]|nr:hypothetical protein [Chitinophagaceae bacterium]
MIKKFNLLHDLPGYPLRGIGGFLLIAFCLFTSDVAAQRDTTRRQTIDITSTYKPVIRNAVKINLSASPLTADTSRPRMAYDIPAQNLFFAYQPISLKPLALTQDTGLQLGIRNYVKAGFGNFTTPYIAAAVSFGDGKKSLMNLYGNYISSRGKITNQNFSELQLRGMGSFFTTKNEVYGKAGIEARQYYQYGYDHAAHTFPKDSVSRKYQDFTVGVGLRNIAVNDLHVNYNPNVEAHIFSRENKVNESTLILEAPVEKKFGESVSLKVSAKADITNFSNKITSANKSITNNLFQVAPELVYYSDMFTFHGGVTPSWDNGVLSVLPNVYGEAQLQHKVFMIQAGWVGRFIKNSFRSLSKINPYMADPSFLKNTKEVQYYGGIKATLGKHFSFNAKAAFVTYNNMPLFVNDFNDGKSFFISNESKMNALQLHGDMSVVSQDKFTLTAALDVNTYTGLKDNANAWHLIPLQLTGSFRWNAFKQVLIKADLFTFSSTPALSKNNTEIKLNGTDLSAGGEFKINKKFSAWLDFNNILNNKYQRFNNYPVYGLNIIGGIIAHF